MTVSSIGSVAEFATNGVTTNFPFFFKFLENEDLVVTYVDVDGVASTLTYGTDYTVNGAGTETGGSVVTSTARLPGQLIVSREMVPLQGTSLRNQGKFLAETHEDVFDKLTMLIQQGFSLFSRALLRPFGKSYYDAQSRNISNLKDPVSDQDATTKHWSREYLTSLISAIQGPINNAANIFFKGPDNLDYVVQDLSDHTSTQKGDALISVKQPYAGAVSRTQHSKNTDNLTAADFGAVGDGTDETVKLKAARDAIGLVELADGKTYRISSQLAATADGQGFWCNGKATILMLTGAGKFDRANYSGNLYGSNGCGVLCEGFDSYILKGVAITMEATASVRTIKAFGLRDSNGSTVEVEAYGFKEAEGGIIGLDSLNECHVVAHVHDCGTANDTLPTMQVTGVSIDDDRINNISTTNSFVRGHGGSILLTGAALVKYGPQTDGMNIAGTGNNYGLKVEAVWDGVGEAFDCFGSFVKATVQAKNCWLYGIKLIHGAQHCIVDGIVDTTVGAAVVFGSSNTATQDVAHNDVTCTASNIGVLSGLAVAKAGFQTDGPSALLKPRDNHVTLILEGSPQTIYAAFIESGQRNTVEYITSGQAMVLQAVITPTAGPGNIIRRLDNKNGGYKVGRLYGSEYTNISSNSPLVIAANVLYAIPFRANDLIQAVRIGAWVSVVGAGSVRFGIYKWLDGVPGELLYDCGVMANTVTGLQEVIINGGNGVSLTEGMYALAMVCDSAFTTFSSTSNAATLGLLGTTNPGGASDNQITAAFAYAPMPSIFPAAIFSANNLPNIWLRR